MRKNAKGVGLAIIGAGRVGLFRGEVAARHPAVEWIGIAELNHNRGGDVAARIGADFVTTDYRALLARPEVTAAIIATDEHLHVAPILAAVERGVPMLIEKPLATELGELRGPMREETDSFLNRVSLGLPTQAATAAEAHDRLMLTKALDLSAKRKAPVRLPLEPDEDRTHAAGRARA